jgi:hypothetical protein
VKNIETIDRHEKTFENQKKTKMKRDRKGKGSIVKMLKLKYVGHRKKENM